MRKIHSETGQFKSPPRKNNHWRRLLVFSFALFVLAQFSFARSVYQTMYSKKGTVTLKQNVKSLESLQNQKTQSNTFAPMIAGETCDDAIIVTSLPFSDAGNTADYGNDYNDGDVPPLAPGAVTTGTGSTFYLTGDDVVYAYTPLENELLRISTTNDDDWVGLWAFTGCPFASTVGFHTSTGGATRMIDELPVEAGETYYFVISTWPTPQSTDYTILIESLETCSGTPDGGTASINPETGASGTTVNLSASDFTVGAGVIYKWEVNINNGGWEDAGLVSDSDINIIVTGSQGDVNEYRYVVTCTGSGETSYSSIASFTFDNSGCIPNYNNGCSNDYLNEFHLTGDNGTQIDRSVTNCEGEYVDLTDEAVDLSAGISYQVNAKTSFSSDMVTIWLIADDGSATLVVPTFNASGAGANADMLVPSSMADGEYTMRVMVTYNATPIDECTPNSSWGQTIDYTAVVSAAEDCGDVEAGTIMDDFTICSGVGFTIETTGATSGEFGLSGQWFSSPSGVNDWTAITGATNSSYTVAGGIAADTDYYFSMSCSVSGEEDSTDTLTVSINTDPTGCYCIPSGTNPNYFIDNFTATGNGDEDISNLNSGFSAGGYGDFSGMVVSANAGEEISISVSYGGTSTFGLRIWVDWSGNGDFYDEGELVLDQSNNAQTSHTATIAVPADADGNYRMRIGNEWLGGGPSDPCKVNHAWGEFEDYTINVSDGGTPPIDYCHPEINCDDGDVILNVTFQEINNDSTCSPGGYGDYTSMVANVESGQNYPISVTVGAGWVEHVSYWIDFGNDGSFDEEDYFGEIGSGAQGGTVSGTVAIPSTVAEGNYRMRILAYAGPANNDPCIQNPSDYGEYEDYTVHVSEGSQSGDGCTWTVIVQDASYFGDEVSWTLKDASGTTLLSGGPYDDMGYYDEQSVFAEGPLEFFITAEGFFGDNTPNYSVANDNGIIVSGTLNGDSATHSDLNCDSTPPPPPAFTCEDNHVDSNNLENGLFFGGETNQRLAIDIIAGESGFTVYGVNLNVFVESGDTDLFFDFTFYENQGGLPGSTIGGQGGTIISTDFVGSAFGYDVYNFVVKFDEPVNFEANTTTWMEVFSTGVAWEARGSGALGSLGAFYNDNVSDWTIGNAEYVYALECEELGLSNFNNYEFAYYPNPASSVLNIQSQKNIQSVSAFNLTGQKVLSDVKVTNGQIDISTLATGTYVFRVVLEGNKVETFKIIKK